MLIRVLLFNTSSERRLNSKNLSVPGNAEDQINTLLDFCMKQALPSDSKPLNGVLLHHGCALNPSRKLSEYGINKDCVLQLVLKDKAPAVNPPDEKSSYKAFFSLTQLASQRQLSALSQVLQSSEHMDAILAQCPFVVTSKMGVLYSLLLHSPHFLICLLKDPPGVKRTLQQHPALAEVTLKIIQRYNNSSASRNIATAPPQVTSSGSSGSALVDLMRQDFSVHQDQSLDDEEEEEGSPRPSGSLPTSSRQPPIGRSAPVSGATASGPPSTQSSRQAISADLFRSALASALSHEPGVSTTTSVAPSAPAPVAATPQHPPTPPTPFIPSNPREVFATQLAALREMGVTDEEVALQMLIATHGNLEAAINLMFG